MGSKICMNELCRTTTSSGWKQGWGLKSGGLATLCFSCGSAYENAVFCQSFHRDESGWRECRVCGKLIHCGCIASRFLYEHMDFGGIRCTNCAKLMEINSMQIPGNASQNGYITNHIGEMRIDNRINDENSSMERLLELSNTLGADEAGRTLHLSRRQTPERKSPAFPKTDNIRHRQGVKDAHESMSQSRLNVCMSTLLVGSSSGLPLDGGNVEGSEQNKAGSSEQGQRSRNAVQKQAVSGPEQNKGTPRAVRPPAEGRGKNQLLPRYWPRITEQELKQLAGDLNSTITPLFEKVLSASDAGRIGRLVLPKACAETYFPTINQSEGIPIKIQDIKGNEWTFQFRFWPNNNSRMYVLEGVTPCIQSLQVQAGDTVTFSKRDPGNQLIIGCRRATTIPDLQDSRTPPVQHGDSSKGASASGHADNPLPSGGRSSDESMQRSMRNPEKRKMKNIKNKRLAMPCDDALELKVTWEEAQELFRPRPNCNPTVVMIGNCEFEEFDEPPIFAKPTIFASRPSGEEEQWTQCDNCSKWRKLPPEVVLTTRWTCNENIWDPDRNSCDAPQDINQEDLDALLNKDSKRRKIADEKAPKEGEPSGLDALATAAVLGGNTGELGEPSVGPTTRHPRHRPGCTCIVCSQPPSGQGRHPQTCKCTVCLTVKRRFRTLMMRRKKKQSDAELVKQKKVKGPPNPVLEIEETVGEESDHEAELFKRKKDKGPANVVLENEEVEDDVMGMVAMENASGLSGPGEPSGSQQLDLNSDPHNENNMLEASAGMSLTNLINAANLPFSVFYESNRVGRGSRPRQHAAADESGGKEAKKKKKSG